MSDIKDAGQKPAKELLAWAQKSKEGYVHEKIRSSWQAISDGSATAPRVGVIQEALKKIGDLETQFVAYKNRNLWQKLKDFLNTRVW